MKTEQFPQLSYTDLEPSLTSLQGYAKVIGKIRRALAPAQRHWAHVSLRVGTTGISTSPIPANSFTFDLTLDLLSHRLVTTTSNGYQWQSSLHGQSVASFCEEALQALSQLGIEPDIDRSLFTDTASGTYNRATIKQYWQAITQIDSIYKAFKGTLRGETSDVQLWPHHIDLAFLWFSGRFVPGVDPEDEENADEQMNFGFSPGDDGIPEPYFYITAYPSPDGFIGSPLPGDAYWHTSGFNGAILTYQAMAASADPVNALMDFLKTAHQTGAALMK